MAKGPVLIVDPQSAFAIELETDFKRLGYEAAAVPDVPQALSVAQTTPLELVISEQRLASGTWLELLNALRNAGCAARFAIATASGSITAAVRAMKLGASAYLAKPVVARNIIDAVSPSLEELGQPVPQAAYCSLERAKWEYIHMTVATAGSIAEAARRLGVERRSLRRMLAKAPPEQ